MEISQGRTLELRVLDEDAGLGASVEDVHFCANVDLCPGGQIERGRE